METTTIKQIDYHNLVAALEGFQNPIPESQAKHISDTFPVFDMVLNECEVTEEFLTSITMDQLELAQDAVMYASTYDESSDDLTAEDYRNPMFEYCHSRDWISEINSLQVVKPKTTFF